MLPDGMLGALCRPETSLVAYPQPKYWTWPIAATQLADVLFDRKFTECNSRKQELSAIPDGLVLLVIDPPPTSLYKLDNHTVKG